MFNELRMAIFRYDHSNCVKLLMEQNSPFSVYDEYEPIEGLPENIEISAKFGLLYLLPEDKSHSIHKSYLGDAFGLLFTLNQSDFNELPNFYLRAYIADLILIIKLLIEMQAPHGVHQLNFLTWIYQWRDYSHHIEQYQLSEIENMLLKHGSVIPAVRHAVYDGDYGRVDELLLTHQNQLNIDETYSLTGGGESLNLYVMNNRHKIILYSTEGEIYNILEDTIQLLGIMSKEHKKIPKADADTFIENTFITIRLLLKHGASINQSQRDVLIGLHSDSYTHLTNKKLLNVTRQLIQSGYTPSENSASNGLLAAIIWANRFSYDYVKLMLDHGLPLCSYPWMLSPLMIAALIRCERTVRLLLESNASISDTILSSNVSVDCVTQEEGIHHDKYTVLELLCLANLPGNHLERKDVCAASLELTHLYNRQLTCDPFTFIDAVYPFIDLKPWQEPKGGIERDPLVQLLKAEHLLNFKNLKDKNLMEKLVSRYEALSERGYCPSVSEVITDVMPTPILMAYNLRYQSSKAILSAELSKKLHGRNLNSVIENPKLSQLGLEARVKSCLSTLKSTRGECDAMNYWCSGIDAIKVVSVTQFDLFCGYLAGNLIKVLSTNNTSRSMSHRAAQP